MVARVDAVLGQVAVPPHQVVQDAPADVHSIINNGAPDPTLKIHVWSWE